jgi:putative chitinase
VNRSAFFASARQSLFPGGLKQSQVTTIDAILDEAGHRGTERGHLAYILATARHEPGDAMEPNRENLYYTKASRIREVWPSRFPSTASAEPFVRNPRALANKVYNGRMGNREGSNDGFDFRGAGLVHLTGRANFEKASKTTGIDLVADPDRAAELGLAVDILFDGMEGGWFTGKSLDDVDDTPGFEDDRAVVNGKDRAVLIAGYARAFETALKAGGYVAGAEPVTPAPQGAIGLAPAEFAAARRVTAWAAGRPEGAAEVLAWLAAMPKELV